MNSLPRLAQRLEDPLSRRLSRRGWCVLGPKQAAQNELVEVIQSGGLEDSETDRVPSRTDVDPKQGPPFLLVACGLACFRHAGVEFRLRGGRHEPELRWVAPERRGILF